MARRTKNRKLKKTYAVLGDGLTEHYYLKHLKKIKSYGYSIKPSLFNRCTINEAKKHIYRLLNQAYNMVIYITDYDTVINQGTQEEFNSFISEFKDNQNVKIYETMPSMEYWFLLHYQFTTRPFRNANEAEQVLKNYIPDYEKSKKFLVSEQWVKNLCENNRMEEAMENSKNSINHKRINSREDYIPFSKMHKAIKQFEGFSRSK